ncbi:hypothetical protein BS78_03G252700 [Paspalum vaginatum]|nr:hypothetical protein BS78_03G252700 [Paspalum vaginatum]
MTIQDLPVDLEKGVITDGTAAATEEEELTLVVDPCKAMFIKIFLGMAFLFDLFASTFVMVKISKLDWRVTWPTLILLPSCLVVGLCMAPTMVRKIIQ